MSLVHTIGLEVSVHDASFAGAFFGCRVQIALWALSYLPVVHYPTNVFGSVPDHGSGGMPPTRALGTTAGVSEHG